MSVAGIHGNRRMVQRLTSAEKDSLLGMLDRLARVTSEPYCESRGFRGAGQIPAGVDGARVEAQKGNEARNPCHARGFPPEFYEYFVIVEEAA